MPKKSGAATKTVKAPKVVTLFCAICEQHIARDTFVAHVREHLSSSEQTNL
jgi:ribosomal protein L44E